MVSPKAAFVAALSTATLFVPPAAAAPAALDWSAGHAETARRMAAAGFGDLAAGRAFLGFDPAGNGRVSEVVGDLATAERIVVLVPGADTTLRDFDSGLGGVARRAPSVQARVIHDAVRRREPAAAVAVVAWLGYDPPEGVGLAAIRRERAEAGAVELRRFVAALPGRATVVVVGHSYGAVVMCLAAAGLGPRVTDLVALASPGMAGLRTSARVWAATAARDWINRVPHVSVAGFGHGPAPFDPAVGARALPATGVAGHDHYLTAGSATVDALAEVVLMP